MSASADFAKLVDEYDRATEHFMGCPEAQLDRAFEEQKAARAAVLSAFAAQQAEIERLTDQAQRAATMLQNVAEENERTAEVMRLREEALDLAKEAWSRTDGGLDLTLRARELDAEADRLEAATPSPVHQLYKTGDADAPEVIKDRNGEVVLGLCRRCGKAEIELDGPCLPAPAQASQDALRAQELIDAAHREPNAMKAAALMAEANMGPFRAALKQKAAKRSARAALNPTGGA